MYAHVKAMGNSSKDVFDASSASRLRDARLRAIDESRRTGRDHKEVASALAAEAWYLIQCDLIELGYGNSDEWLIAYEHEKAARKHVRRLIRSRVAGKVTS